MREPSHTFDLITRIKNITSITYKIDKILRMYNKKLHAYKQKIK